MRLPRLTFAAAVAFAATASAASAQDTMSEEQCFAVLGAMSKLELSMVGKVPLEDARAALSGLQSTVPESVWPRINDLVAVAEAAQGREPGDPAHPMATGQFQQASTSYREALAPYCPGFHLDY